MSKNSRNNQSSQDNDPCEEQWVSKNEILKKYDVSDRNLTYWRGIGKIRYKNVRNRTFYIESDVAAMAEKQKKPKTYFGIRKPYFPKKLKDIDPVLGAVIIGLIYTVANGIELPHGPWYRIILYNWTFFFIIIIAIVYGGVKLMKYGWRGFFKNHKDPE